MFIANEMIPGAAAQLLGRTLTRADGIGPSVVIRAEKRLHIALPEALKQFYLLAGNLPLFTHSFHRIAGPQGLVIQDHRLIFAEENQGVCLWGADLSSLEVFLYSDGEWYLENVALPQFLTLLLFYNCAQGGYEFTGSCGAEAYPAIQKELSCGWQRKVEHKGLLIFAQGDNLIWFFYGAEGRPMENIFLSSRTEKGYDEICERVSFMPL